jgi:uncharacterized protein (DUF1697 family)
VTVFVALVRGINVGSTRKVPMAKLREICLAAEDFAPERFRVQGREIFLHLPQGQARSKLLEALTRRAKGLVTTARNWKTVAALQEMASGR